MFLQLFYLSLKINKIIAEIKVRSSKKQKKILQKFGGQAQGNHPKSKEEPEIKGSREIPDVHNQGQEDRKGQRQGRAQREKEFQLQDDLNLQYEQYAMTGKI